MVNDYLIKLLDKEIDSLRSELQKAESERDKLMNLPSTDNRIELEAETNKRSFRWTKMVLETISKVDKLISTEELYPKIYESYEDVQALERNKRISSLSGAVNTLKKKGSIKYIEDSIGTRLYGLADFFENEGIPYDKYIAKMKDDDYDLSRFSIEKIGLIEVPKLEEDEMPF